VRLRDGSSTHAALPLWVPITATARGRNSLREPSGRPATRSSLQISQKKTPPLVRCQNFRFVSSGFPDSHSVISGVVFNTTLARGITPRTVNPAIDRGAN
jgi:hypothetical protein